MRSLRYFLMGLIWPKWRERVIYVEVPYRAAVVFVPDSPSWDEEHVNHLTAVLEAETERRVAVIGTKDRKDFYIGITESLP